MRLAMAECCVHWVSSKEADAFIERSMPGTGASSAKSINIEGRKLAFVMIFNRQSSIISTPISSSRCTSSQAAPPVALPAAAAQWGIE